MSKPVSFSSDELGLNLEEDSEDLHAEEIASAVETSDGVDFAKKVAAFVRDNLEKGSPTYALRRNAGILYCRASLVGASCLFKIDWLRRSP